MEVADSLGHKRAILDYWTLVEFFSPYLLDNVLNTGQHYQRIFIDDPGTQPLPWMERAPIPKGDPATPFAKGYNLYLGLFSTEETADRARHAFYQRPSRWESVNWRQCASPGTTTCFARLSLTKFGLPLLGSLSLSTLPWAHGNLLIGDQENLTVEQYWKSVNRLLTFLKEEWVQELPSRLVKLPNEHTSYLDYPDLRRLVKKLFSWAGFEPRDYPLALIEPLGGDETVVAKEGALQTERDIPILNSFYIQELEAASRSLESSMGSPLDLYLGGKSNQREPLENEKGKRHILDLLQPANLPSGRWPDRPSHQQSLMQQFAINMALESPLLSVNGPPGTGKTTLLREIVAENMVKRATALAQFKGAKEAFVGKRAIGFGDGAPVIVSDLHPALLGYEMLVVSSNNAAVQNLSHELPLRSALDSSFAHASYLEPVAKKVLPNGTPWGLISASLGNLSNCRRLVESLFMVKGDEGDSLRIWEWIDECQGVSFTESRNRFLSKQKEHAILVGELDELALLHDELHLHTLESYCESESAEFDQVEKQIERLESELSALYKEQQDTQELHDLLEKRAELWEKERPRLVMRMWGSDEWSSWSEKASDYNKQRIIAVEKLHETKLQVQKNRKQLDSLYEEKKSVELAIFDRALYFQLSCFAYDQLRERHPTCELPDGPDALDDPEIQKGCFYQTETLNTLRSELFVAAMALHEAWLAETLRPKGGFRGNLLAISNLLQGKSPTTADDTRVAWQSLFLLIPMLSSTFASVGRLFKYLEPALLGWVLIDEAGQTLPQAAVGAIWRAKRVLSIGDPFQIEPISTIPPEIVDGMAKSRLQDNTLLWAPSQVSVQNLMDRAARYGSWRHVRDHTHWLGAPLRVHRRSIEPMFTIANTIAYEGSMILATPNHPCPLPPSCWYDVSGSVSERQYVASQGEMLVKKLKEVLVLMSSPDVYVISPFREVVRQIRYLVFHDESLKELFEGKFSIGLRSWVHQAVGTVHTFQGKQAAVVFFVLGADTTTTPSIEWATRKPNLLNVAITRAQFRAYLIGEYALWCRWPYFDTAAELLPRVIPNGTAASAPSKA